MIFSSTNTLTIKFFYLVLLFTSYITSKYFIINHNKICTADFSMINYDEIYDASEVLLYYYYISIKLIK